MGLKNQHKHIIIARLFEFGGSNGHLATLIKYLGRENVILVLMDADELRYLKNIENTDGILVKIKPHLHSYAHLQYRFTTNVKELFKILYSIMAVKFLSLRYRCKSITICSVEPEKFLYLLWVPFVKVFYTLHSTPSAKFTGFTSFTCNSRLGKGRMIVTVSHANKQLIYKNWGIAAPKVEFVHVIYNCIPDDSLYSAPKKTKRQNQKTVLTLGHVIAYKNPFIWLEVAKLVTEVKNEVDFVWLGDGPLLGKMKENSKTFDRISFKGFIEKPGAYLECATVYYQPSLNETHGIAVIEAMANSLPCVVADVGGLPESVQNQYNGLLVNATDARQHADAILKLMDSPELRAQFGQKGYEKYRESFTYSVFKTSMNAIYPL